MKKKSLFKLKSTASCVAFGSVISFVFSVIILLILSAVLVNYDISKASVKYLWFIVAVIGGFAGGACCGKFVKSKGIIWGALSAVIVSLILIVIFYIFNTFNVSVFCFILMPIYAVFGALGGVISSNLR